MSKFYNIYSRLLNTYRHSHKMKFDSDGFFFSIYRSISFPISAIFILLGITANFVTLISFLFLVLASILLINGNFIFGAIIYFTAYILDFVDGNIARYHGLSSFFGKFIDGFVDVFTFLIFLAIGIGYHTEFNHTKSFDPKVMPLAVAVSFQFLLISYFHIRVAYIKTDLTSKEGLSILVNNQTSPRKFNFIKKLIKFILNLFSTGLPIFCLIFLVFNLIPQFVYLYSLLYLLLSSFEILYKIWVLYFEFNVKREF